MAGKPLKGRYQPKVGLKVRSNESLESPRFKGLGPSPFIETGSQPQESIYIRNRRTGCAGILTNQLEGDSDSWYVQHSHGVAIYKLSELVADY